MTQRRHSLPLPNVWAESPSRQDTDDDGEGDEPATDDNHKKHLKSHAKKHHHRKKKSRRRHREHGSRSYDDDRENADAAAYADAPTAAAAPSDERAPARRRVESIGNAWVGRPPCADDDADEVGPRPPPQPVAAREITDYGGALRPGEGEGMAAYVQSGERIPRRGEIGLSAADIERYEAAGYVMSGSRHKRMEAVRVRKEMQVYSAEEKRALAVFNQEQKAARESQILAGFRQLVASKIGGQSGPSNVEAAPSNEVV